jgi:16S rRNA (guanine527-N7)-methyltransferase
MGTGAGFPGLPIKLILHDLDITFLDSSQKKMMVLENICQELGIQGYKVLAGNIETIGHDINHRETYDYVFCRALSSLNILIEFGVPLLKENGLMVIYKGQDILEEVENSSRALNELQARILEKHEISLPFSDFKRSILMVEKIWKTNGKYPRKPGIPRKKPL